MKRVLTAAVSLCFVSILHAQVDAKLADAVKHAKVSLDAGLKASEREGKPISGKFELDEGKLQLSVIELELAGDRFAFALTGFQAGIERHLRMLHGVGEFRINLGVKNRDKTK